MSRSASVARLRWSLSFAALAAVVVLPVSVMAQNTELTPSPDDPDVTNRSEARYTITFTGAWTTTVTPGGLPGIAHFSPLIGGVHNDQVKFLESGGTASAGVELMAESGSTSTLRNEINAAAANRLSVIQGSGNVGPEATVTFSDIALTTDHPRVTLVTMIAPSPDWFVGVSGLSMLDGSGNWKESVSANLYPWDAGTEEGTEFALNNLETAPRGVITSIRNTGKFNDNKMATLTFTRTSILPAAPTIDAVHSGDEALTVVWTAPSGVTDITAYDLRWILTSSDETVDSNWAVVDDAWTEGPLRSVVTGLTDGAGYDVQVRAVTDVDGSWSGIVAGTPAEPGNTRAAATGLPLDVPLGGDIDGAGDLDYFEFTLSEETAVSLFTRGDLNTVGTLYDGNGNLVGSNDDSPLHDEERNFLIVRPLGAGTYYLEVAPAASTDTGVYVVHARPLADTTGTDDAQEVEVGSSDYALIEPEQDEDYFKFTLDAETDVILRTGPPVTDTVGELLDDGGASLATSDNGFVPGSEHQFLFRRKLGAGTYYVKVSASHEATGLYLFHVETVTEPGSSTTDALALDLDELIGGRIDPSTDADFFRIVLPRAAHVFARAVSNTVDIDGQLLDSQGDPSGGAVYEETFTSDGPMGFTVADRLDAGTHYLKVTRSGGDMTGGYALHMSRDLDMDVVVFVCSSGTPPFSDPLSRCQWHLLGDGQIGGSAGQDINVRDVWAAGNMGAGVTVAVLDDGLHEDHPDLVDNVDKNRGHDYTGGDGLHSALDSHGTQMAGVIAARDNDIGGRGVAPRATIYGYNLVQAEEIADLVDAMNRNMATTAVSNNSWALGGGPGLDTVDAAWEMAVDTGVTAGYGGKGVFYVFGGGNHAGNGDNSNLTELTSYYAVTTVCAANNRGQRSRYSEEGANLWVCAPSSDAFGILTTVNYGRYTDTSGGTSAAAATVSGVAALVRAENANLTWRDVKLILAGSARKNDSSDGGWRTGARKYGAAGNYNFNHDYGFGVVNAKAAVDLADGWENLPPFMEAGPVEVTPDLAIPDAGTGSPGATQTSSLTVGTKVEFIEFVEINADFDAPAFRDLQLEIVSPSNAVSVLSVPYESSSADRYGLDTTFRFGSAKHLGEDPAGVWALRITDHVNGGDAATLRSWSLKIYGHRSTPGAPAAPTATPGQRALTVFWSTPSVIGASDVTGYDVRYIRSDATDRADNRWTEQKGIWTSGALNYMVTGLLDGTDYDVQVRGVNAKGGGAWSESATVETLPNRAPIAVGSLVGPVLQVGDGNESVDVSSGFEDPDMDTLTYDTSSSVPGVADARMSGSRVTLTPVARGNATITVTATDVAGSNTPAEQRFDVRVKGRRGVTISRDALTVGEGSTKTYTVMLDSEPTGTVTVTPSVPANRNLSVDPPEVEFTTGDWQIPKTVFVEAERDANTNSEPPVTIGHRVSGADYGSVSAASVRVTIVETDTSVLSVESAAAAENSGPIVFQVTLSKESTSEITVDYATSNGSAQQGSDYTRTNGTLTFPASLTASRQIFVDLIDDANDEEEEETFRLTLSNARHASLAGGGSTLRVLGTIRDDDEPEVEVSFGSASYGVTEGGTVTVVVRLDRDPERDLVIDLLRTHHGGTTDADYSGVPPSVTFGPGVRTQEFLFAATDDNTDDDGESVVLSFLSLPSLVTGSGETTLAIQDNDGGSTGGPGGPGGAGPGPGGGGPPPGDDDDDGGGVQPPPPPPPSGPPKAEFTLTAVCPEDLCRARTGLAVTFEDTSSGRVQSRRWDFGDGTTSRNRRIDHAWSSPGFYEVTLTVSDGTTVSTAKQVFLVEASDPAGTCVADAETLCLQDSRYAVDVEWRTADGGSGAASVVRSGTNDSGLFWFFGRDNWEILIKVLDGCALNGHVWVFGASTTDLGYVIRVTDTVTGAVKEYRNEPGLPAPAITDGTAFAEGCRP